MERSIHEIVKTQHEQRTTKEKIKFWDYVFSKLMGWLQDQKNLLENELLVHMHEGIYLKTKASDPPSRFFGKVIIAWEGGQLEIPNVRCYEHAFASRDEAIESTYSLVNHNVDKFMPVLEKHIPVKEYNQRQDDLGSLSHHKSEFSNLKMLSAVEQYNENTKKTETVLKQIRYKIHSPDDRCVFPLNKCIVCQKDIQVRDKFCAPNVDDGQTVQIRKTSKK